MSKFFQFLLFLIIGCAEITPKEAAKFETKNYFPQKQGCFLLYNVKSGIIDRTIGDENCKKQVVASSSFKIPLAIMAFDSGVLKDENQVLKWDGIKHSRPELNQDHNAKTWMRDSVVWFSQEVAKKIGKKKLQKYLNDFNYGNKHLASNFTESWLISPSSPEMGLWISPDEQLEFMKVFWASALPVSKRSIALVKKIMYLETSPKGYVLSGKTGSNIFFGDPQERLGWFIAHLEKEDQEYIAITNFIDIGAPLEKGYGGLRAKEITKEILTDSGLW
jgi:beta-lactamase class D